MSNFSSRFFSLCPNVAIGPFVDESKWWAHSHLYYTWFTGYSLFPTSHKLFLPGAWAENTRLHFISEHLLWAFHQGHCVSRCVYSSVKGKVRSADAFHFVILCKWCVCNCLPSVPRSGNSLHEASPTEPAPEQNWLQNRMPVAHHLGNWVFTFISK